MRFLRKNLWVALLFVIFAASVSPSQGADLAQINDAGNIGISSHHGYGPRGGYGGGYGGCGC